MNASRLTFYVSGLALFAFLVNIITPNAYAESSTTFTVNDTLDAVDANPGDGICETAPGNGICTLRAAVIEANALEGLDTIFLPAEKYYLTIPGSSEYYSQTGDLNISDSLIIIGEDVNATIIDATLAGDRAIQIWPMAALVSISEVRFKHGYSSAQGGGAIFSEGNLWLTHVQLLSNYTEGSGGAISSTGHLYLKDVYIDGNQGYFGGGIYSNDSLFLDGTTLVNNTAITGGGLYLNAGTVEMVNSSIIDNSADDCAGLYNKDALEIKSSYFIDNTAIDGNGGGLCNQSPVNISLIDVVFYNNISSHGGAIHNDAEGDIHGSNLTFDSNTATLIGGAILNASGVINSGRTILSGNQSTYGGAIYNLGAINLYDTTIENNSASESGGGIDTTSSSIIILSRVTLSGNQARIGGAISNNGLLQIENSTISGNTALSDGGGIYNSGNTEAYNLTIVENMAAETGDTGDGGGVYAVPASTFTFRNTILYGNHHMRLITPYNDDCYGTLTTQDYNLVGNLVNCTLDNDHGLDIIGENPMIERLADNGGATYTHALRGNSPAIDAANFKSCFGIDNRPLVLDQRGYLRNWDSHGNGIGRCDIGSYEFGSRLPFFLFLPYAKN
jgi:predicted outer membrane repeat protein